MASNFINDVQVNIPGTNYFDMSYDKKMSCKGGFLIPCGRQDVLPSDHWTISEQVLTKFAPLVSPVMHRMNVSIHNWFVPYRLLWNHWDDWIAQRSVHVFPYVVLDNTNTGPGSLADYLGFPFLEEGVSRQVSAFPFAAYQFIYHEWYRDQNLIPVYEAFHLEDGDNTLHEDLFVLRKRAWMHDMFTSAAPDTQVGDPVQITPSQGYKDVKVKFNDTPTSGLADPSYLIANSVNAVTTGDGSTASITGGNADTDDAVFNAVPDALYAETSDLDNQAVTVNDLRLAERLQVYRERLRRVGRRFTEWLLGVWGVKSEDFRLQLPEYISGSVTPVIISDIMSTTGINNGENISRPLADRGGTAMSVNSQRVGRYHAKEHGMIMSLYSCMPVTAYQQGIMKMDLKFDPLDWYTPDLAGIGEQPVKVKELYNGPDTVDPEAVFGYLAAYYDTRIRVSEVSGEFRNNLSHWHMGRIFADEPALNQNFVECDFPTRIFAVENGADYLYVHVLHGDSAIRRVTKFGIPSL